ncbi:MAG: hypothetical protein M3Q06_11030 [Bacteroidota bacterium]|nr:hypothetical protein [Bacteroidota bacterium]
MNKVLRQYYRTVNSSLIVQAGKQTGRRGSTGDCLQAKSFYIATGNKKAS